CDALTEDNTWHPTKKPMQIIIHHENDGFTFGLCSTGGFAAGPAWGVSECLAVDKHGLFTYTTTATPSAGNPLDGGVGAGSSFGFRAELTNGEDKEDLAGPFKYLEVG